MARRLGRIKVAVYHGDELEFIGTVEDAAKELGLLPKTIRYYMTPTYLKRFDEYKHPARARRVIVVPDDE